MDVQKAGGEIPAPGVQNLNGRCVRQMPNRGDLPAGKRHVPLPGRGAGAIQDPGVLNEIIEHDRASFFCCAQCNTLPEALQGGQLLPLCKETAKFFVLY